MSFLVFSLFSQVAAADDSLIAPASHESSPPGVLDVPPDVDHGVAQDIVGSADSRLPEQSTQFIDPQKFEVSFPGVELPNAPVQMDADLVSIAAEEDVPVLDPLSPVWDAAVFGAILVVVFAIAFALKRFWPRQLVTDRRQD
jgi:hypothetical protein